MRGIAFLAFVVVVLIAAGVITVSWNNGTATIHVDKQKARERAAQVLQEGKRIEAQLEQNLHQPQASQGGWSTDQARTPFGAAIDR